MSNPFITINLVIHNGEKYIRQCLDSVFKQSYPHEFIELNILDNASTDSTASVTESRIENLKLKIENCSFLKIKTNLGMWPGQELLLEHSRGKYVVVLSVDVILHPDFIKNTIEVMERDEKIGALQAKVYKYELDSLRTYDPTHLRTDVIDTLGFQIFRSRRIVNTGHGEVDHGQYDQEREIFAVEGAVPVFRRVVLEDCRLESQTVRGTVRGSTSNSLGGRGLIVDPDFFWYGDDLDLVWRMRMFGWKQVYAPSVIAWHDRKTTKALAGDWREFIKIRRTVPLFKRRLDWRNTTLAIIKNDFVANWLRDLPFILWRQLQMWVYFLIFEPAMFLEIFNVAKMLPRMLKRRREIMRKAKISPQDFRKWIQS